MENNESNEIVVKVQSPLLILDEPVLVSPQVAGFWWRILALVIDSVLVGIVGSILGAIFFDQFVVMGDWSRLIGLAIFLAYFGLLNSKLGRGQTLGKRMFKIKVVDGMGELIPVRISMLRALILGIPGILNNLTTTPGFMDSPVKMVFWFFVGVILFGGGAGIIYFYIFNRNTRQSLHDLICRTYVTPATGSGAIAVKPVWRGHYIVYSVLLGLMVIGAVVVNIVADRIPFFKEIMSVNEQLGDVKGIYGANVNQGVMWGPNGKFKYLTISVDIRDRRLMNQGFATKVVSTVMKNNHDATEVQMINVVINYGYNIGIASNHRNIGGQFSPDEWRKIINDSAGANENGAFEVGISTGVQ